jgi:hypothetical protein
MDAFFTAIVRVVGMVFVAAPVTLIVAAAVSWLLGRRPDGVEQLTALLRSCGELVGAFAAAVAVVMWRHHQSSSGSPTRAQSVGRRASGNQQVDHGSVPADDAPTPL